MELLSEEKYPGVAGELFEIKVIGNDNEKMVAINLLYTEHEDEFSANISNASYPADTSVSEIIEKAKLKIQTITIINRQGRDTGIRPDLIT